jgi:16S rRNA processing protein RimM
MGRVSAPYGVRGWIKVQPYSEEPDALLGHARWWLRAREGWRSHAVLDARLHSGAIVAQLAAIDQRECAAALRGADVGIERSALPRLRAGEHYHASLVGLNVVNRAGECLGRVSAVLDSPAHALLEVAAGDGRKRLIPAVPAIVDAIEVDAGLVRVDWALDY